MELLSNLTRYKISNRDIKIILIIGALALLFCAYRFVYYPNVMKAASIRNEIIQLEARKNELQRLQDRAEEVQKENQSMKNRIDQLIQHYGTGSSYQKSILFIESLQQQTGMEVSSIGLSDPETTTTVTQEEDATISADTKTSVDIKTSADTAQAADGLKDIGTSVVTEATNTSALAPITGYASVVTIDYKVNYEGLKKCIQYIKNYPQRMSIKELTIVYDMGTGNLSGTMQINMYHLANTEIKEETPAIAGVEIGNQNIFGTIEITSEAND